MQLQYRYTNSEDEWSEWINIALPVELTAAWRDQKTEFRLKPTFVPGYFMWVGEDIRDRESAVWLYSEPDSLEYWIPVTVTPRKAS